MHETLPVPPFLLFFRLGRTPYACRLLLAHKVTAKTLDDAGSLRYYPPPGSGC